MSGQLMISWSPASRSATYVLDVHDLFDKSLYKEETKETSHLLDLTIPSLASEKLIMVAVSEKGSEETQSTYHGLQRLTEEEAASYQSDLQQLLTAIDPNTSMGQVALAGFFELKELLVDAKTAYHKAHALSPQVADYKALYEQFLLRNGLKAE